MTQIITKADNIDIIGIHAGSIESCLGRKTIQEIEIQPIYRRLYSSLKLKLLLCNLIKYIKLLK